MYYYELVPTTIWRSLVDLDDIRVQLRGAAASSFAGEVNQPHNDCSPFLFQCGKIQHDINYPFWTKDYPGYCSYEKKFEIKCNQTDNSSEIVIQSHNYHVEEINYENKTVTIVDKDYFDHNKEDTCLRPSRNTTLDFKLFGYYFERDPNEGDRFEGDGMLLFLYNFSTNLVEDHPNPFNIKPLKCLFVSNQSSEFEVKWSMIEPHYRCWDCVQSNGHCGYNVDSPPNPTCHYKGKPHLYMCPLGKHLSSSSQLDAISDAASLLCQPLQ
ncbi:LEAF RUST 10 DISEASE-RESISTANCE LOCUS RECEPTOR-LIKE PROTEIN KINASE-like protein 1.2 [Cinnamomum micranthum f. kanehirae]|uniref:LEAF RUST 10 DISEASE-RESISTANCE LOCUS RECEPTOR-LIKE PROTEIN KINASE-like protein 1.2 n=1 Tax=Cinnamomum micranthum f. kanehirae TaxID=337451 RepID=A0A3S3QB71_9MAGN|nr:LEAF RUST 10 DISEASE-RESISTANCE LOCUS RECEPTOR-LIKE PROTEIN KINASE-like protein 1.2 [Cinnamomum micranthum f. kanehirae]